MVLVSMTPRLVVLLADADHVLGLVALDLESFRDQLSTDLVDGHLGFPFLSLLGSDQSSEKVDRLVRIKPLQSKNRDI